MEEDSLFSIPSPAFTKISLFLNFSFSKSASFLVILARIWGLVIQRWVKPMTGQGLDKSLLSVGVSVIPSLTVSPYLPHKVRVCITWGSHVPGHLGCRWPHSCSFPAPVCPGGRLPRCPRAFTGARDDADCPASDSPPTYGQSVQFSSVAQSCLILSNSMDCSTPGLPVHHQLLEFTQTHLHWVSDAIQPSHPLSSPSPPAYLRSVGFLFCVQVLLYFLHRHEVPWCFAHSYHTLHFPCIKRSCYPLLRTCIFNALGDIFCSSWADFAAEKNRHWFILPEISELKSLISSCVLYNPISYLILSDSEKYPDSK